MSHSYDIQQIFDWWMNNLYDLIVLVFFGNNVKFKIAFNENELWCNHWWNPRRSNYMRLNEINDFLWASHVSVHRFWPFRSNVCFYWEIFVWSLSFDQSQGSDAPSICGIKAICRLLCLLSIILPFLIFRFIPDLILPQT